MLCSGFLFGTTFITATNVAEAWLDDSNSTTVYAMIDQLMIDGFYIHRASSTPYLCMFFYFSNFTQMGRGVELYLEKQGHGPMPVPNPLKS